MNEITLFTWWRKVIFNWLNLTKEELEEISPEMRKSHIIGIMLNRIFVVVGFIFGFCASLIGDWVTGPLIFGLIYLLGYAIWEYCNEHLDPPDFIDRIWLCCWGCLVGAIPGYTLFVLFQLI